MEVVVQTLELCEQRAKPQRPRRNGASRGLLHRLAEGARVTEASDRGHALGQRHAVGQPASLEPLFHSAVLEEQLRMIVDDVLADVCENELRRFDDIRAHRAERQALDIAVGDFRQSPSARFERHFEAGGIVEAHRRRRRSRPGVQHEPLGLRLTGERDAEQIAHLTLVPTERRTDVGDAGNGAVRRAAPDNEALVAGLAGDVTQLDPFRHVPPSVREPRTPTASKQRPHQRGQVLRRDRQWLERTHRGAPTPECAIAIR